MSRSIHQIIENQMKQWELLKQNPPEIIETCRVVTVSRESGSQGKEVAEGLAGKMGFDMFHHEIVEAMIETSKNSKALLETLDERGVNVVDDIVSNFVNEHHLWPDEYSKLLLRIMNTIGKHGNAVILGRGANFALERINALKVRIVAPDAIKRAHIQKSRDLNYEDAEKFRVSTDANRTAFVKRYFNSDAGDPANYDLILNTGTLSVDKAVDIICCALQ